VGFGARRPRWAGEPADHERDHRSGEVGITARDEPLIFVLVSASGTVCRVMPRKVFD
jgi:hypothetical protein